MAGTFILLAQVIVLFGLILRSNSEPIVDQKSIDTLQRKHEVSEVIALYDPKMGLVFYKDPTLPACFIQKVIDPRHFQNQKIVLAGKPSNSSKVMSEFQKLFCSNLRLFEMETNPMILESNRRRVHRNRRRRNTRQNYPSDPSRGSGNGQQPQYFPGSQTQIEGNVAGKGYFSGQAQSQYSGLSQSQLQLGGVGITGSMSSVAGGAQSTLRLGVRSGSGQISSSGLGPSASELQLILGDENQESRARATVMQQQYQTGTRQQPSQYMSGAGQQYPSQGTRRSQQDSRDFSGQGQSTDNYQQQYSPTDDRTQHHQQPRQYSTSQDYQNGYKSAQDRTSQQTRSQGYSRSGYPDYDQPYTSGQRGEVQPPRHVQHTRTDDTSHTGGYSQDRQQQQMHADKAVLPKQHQMSRSDVGRGSTDVGQGVTDIGHRRSTENGHRGSTDSLQRGSTDLGRSSTDMGQGSTDIGRGLTGIGQRWSTDIGQQGSMDIARRLTDFGRQETDNGQRRSADFGQGPIDSLQRGSTDMGRGSTDIGHRVPTDFGRRETDIGHRGSADFGQGSTDLGRGSTDMGQGATDIARRGSTDIGQQGSTDIGHRLPTDSGRRETDIGHRGSADFGQGSTDSLQRGSTDEGRGSTDLGRKSTDMGPGSTDIVRRGSTSTNLIDQTRSYVQPALPHLQRRREGIYGNGLLAGQFQSQTVSIGDFQPQRSSTTSNGNGQSRLSQSGIANGQRTYVGQESYPQTRSPLAATPIDSSYTDGSMPSGQMHQQQKPISQDGIPDQKIRQYGFRFQESQPRDVPTQQPIIQYGQTFPAQRPVSLPSQTTYSQQQHQQIIQPSTQTQNGIRHYLPAQQLGTNGHQVRRPGMHVQESLQGDLPKTSYPITNGRRVYQRRTVTYYPAKGMSMNQQPHYVQQTLDGGSPLQSQQPIPDTMIGQPQYSGGVGDPNSDCQIITFTCTVIFENNGKSKLCRPKPTTGIGQPNICCC